MSDGIWLVNNPRAGAGKAHLVARHVLRVLREIGEDPVWIQTEGEGDATKMVRKALEAGARGIVVVGGDGTLGEAASGFFDGKNSKHNGTFFVPITAGTGGDFRRNLGTPNFVHLSQSEITNWVKRIWFTSPRAIDVGWIRFTMSDGKISERIFLNIASFGISGLVDALVNASPKWMGGRAAFLIGTARALFQYKPQPVKITLDGGKVIEQEVMVVAVANGRCFGGGMCIAPKAQLDDGLLELTIVRQLSKPLDIDLLWRLYACRIHERRDVHLERIRVIEATPLHSGQRIWLDVDGEAVGLLPAMIEVIPSSLWIKWPSTGQPW